MPAKVTGAIITGLPTSFHWVACRVSESLSQSSCARPVIDPVRVRRRRVDLHGELLVPVGAEVEQAELDEVAVLQPPVDLGAVAEGRGAVEADRHPLVVRLLAGRATCRPVALDRRCG